jgi:two-component system response regulator HydG
MNALTSREIQPTDGTNAVRVSVRILAATSRDLTQMVKDGLFRSDLYRLLSVVNLRIPPLRGRPDDIAFLAKRFLEKIQGQTGLTRTLSSETLQLLETYDWPDNIRELENTIAWACSRTAEPELGESHFPPKLLDFYREVKMVRTTNQTSVPVGQRIVPISKMEKHAILRAIQETNGDKMMAAELLGIGKTTLYRKLKEYGISEEPDSDMHLASPANSAEVHARAVPVSACG